MAVIIEESEMKFGEYEEENIFYLEKSIQYKKNLRQNGVKSCEFILCRDNSLYFIEAKKTCPKQITADTSEEKILKYNEYIQDIVLKMRHSLTIYSSILLKRYDANGIPAKLRKNDLSNLKIRLMLIIKDAEKEWLIPFQDDFNKRLQAELRIWNIPGFIIINEATARDKHFIK